MRINKYLFETNPTVMKKVQWAKKSQKYNSCVICDWCMGGKGCNFRAKNRPNRSWKKYRNFQWRINE